MGKSYKNEQNAESARLLYSVREVESLTGISRSKLFLLIKSGILKKVKVGRSTRIRRADLDAFLESLHEG